MMRERALSVLSDIRKKPIYSFTDEPAARKLLDLARKSLMPLAQLRQMPGPGMTSSIATTLLGVGLCEELSQRFALEYILKYQDQQVNLVFLANPDSMHDNHFVVLIGDVNAPDHLIKGRGASEISIYPKECQPIKSFFEKNPRAVIADPLLDAVCVVGEDMALLNAYCHAHKITHVAGIRSYKETPHLLETAPSIKANAIRLCSEFLPIVHRLVGQDTLVRRDKDYVRVHAYQASSHMLDVLEHIVKTPDVKVNKKQHTVSMHSFWLSQLSKPAIQNLAQELHIPEDSLRPST